MLISHQIHELELAYPFQISKGLYHKRDNIIIALHQDKHTGYGEATAINYYGQSVEKWLAKLNMVSHRLSAIPLLHPKSYHYKIKPLLDDFPFLLSAFDCAAYDLYGKIHGKTVSEIIGTEAKSNLPLTSFTIGLDKIEVMKEKIIEKPWPYYKIKLGVENDLDILRALRKITSSPFRIDANEGWSIEETKAKLPELIKLDVELVEQPVKRAFDEQLGPVSAKSILPIIADESCQTINDIHRCKGNYHGINIKLMKCGGITPALEMISLARKYNMKIMVGCMTESTIGISAGAQLIPLVDYVDLDGTMLIKNDLARGIRFEKGQVHFSKQPGLGFTCLST